MRQEKLLINKLLTSVVNICEIDAKAIVKNINNIEKSKVFLEFFLLISNIKDMNKTIKAVPPKYKKAL